MMGELSRAGLVESSVPLGTRVCEYAVKFDDGKILAIDSKVVATSELDRLHADGLSEEERNEMASQIIARIRGKIDEVASYIDPGRTVPFAVMAIPDSIIEYGTGLMAEASRRNVIVLGYSSVPPLIEYFYKVHSAYSVQQDVALIYAGLARVNTSLNKFTDAFFANRFSKPLKTMATATAEIQDGIRRALLSASPEQLTTPETNTEILPSQPDTDESESEGKDDANPFRDYDSLPKT
jgi:DNA anti-recombination protein RmuC